MGGVECRVRTVHDVEHGDGMPVLVFHDAGLDHRDSELRAPPR